VAAASPTGSVLDGLYPAGPEGVPDGFTLPSRRYRAHAWLAVAGIVAFILLYLATLGFFASAALRFVIEIATGAETHPFQWMMTGVCASITILLVKGLFFVKPARHPGSFEITAAEEPVLFEFLERLARESDAPRPHRVFVSHLVNAAVSYDLSVLGLFFSSRKDLDVGLGLVNALSLSEFKAVLAHEFGHFAQRSMAVGRWVYVAQQIATQIVYRRDRLDRLLVWLGNLPLWVAWVGWVISLVVWSIRSLLETVFVLVQLAHRALTREMEMQADLVSVSLSGSDALPHALHRLQAADDAMDRALAAAAGELKAGRAFADLFAIQERITHHVVRVLGAEEYGTPPPVPSDGRSAHRVFADQIATPPRMWATHPSNREREENAKAYYLPAPADDRPAWLLFSDPDQLRRRSTQRLIDAVPHADALEQPPEGEILERIDADFAGPFFDLRYQGVYLGRSVVRHAATPSDLYAEADASDDIPGALDRLYPDSLRDQLTRVRDLGSELWMLEALQGGHLEPPDGVIRHRDRTLRRADLPAAIAAVRREREEAEAVLVEHDRRVRTAHLRAAASLHDEWAARLRGLAATMHYADHVQADLLDLRGVVQNVVAVITADGHVSRRESLRLLAAARDLHRALAQAYAGAGQVRLDYTVARKMGIEQWSDAIGTFGLPAPSLEELNGWMSVLDSWVDGVCDALSGLYRTSLAVLLQHEDDVARWARGAGTPRLAGRAARVPETYATLLPGSERALQTHLGWWDRFRTGDGVAPTLVRSGVAILIVGATIALGHSPIPPDVGDWLDAVRTRGRHASPIPRYDPLLTGWEPRADVCSRRLAALQGGPPDDERLFLSAQCIPDAAERRRAFAAHLRDRPQSGWLMLGLAYDLAGDQAWADALGRMELAATRLPVIADAISLDIARIRPLALGQERGGIGDLALRSASVGHQVALASGAPYEDHPFRAYSELARGRIEDAYLTAQDDADAGARILWLVAASDGAPPDAVRHALSLAPGRGIDAASVWIAAAVRLRGGLALDGLEPDLRASTPHAPALLEILRAPGRMEGESGGSASLRGLPPREQGIAYATASILGGRRVPASWRRNASRLLFPTERPYFDLRE